MNAALTSQYQYEANDLQVRRANYAILQLALVEAGYEADRFSVLNPACQTNLLVMEKRKAQWTQVYLNALAAGVDLETFPDIRECELGTTDGVELAGSYASLTTALAGADNDLVFTSTERGIVGNGITIRYSDPGANNIPLSVNVTGEVITIILATDGAGVITSTANSIMAAVNADSLASAMVNVTLAAGNTGTGVVTALAPTGLSGGSSF
jgi:hypothetical protein